MKEHGFWEGNHTWTSRRQNIDCGGWAHHTATPLPRPFAWLITTTLHELIFQQPTFPISIFPNFCIRILCLMIWQSWLQKRCSVRKHFHGWPGRLCCQEQLLRWLWNRWGVKNPTMKPGKKGLLPYYTFKSPTEAFSRENMGVRSWLIFVIFARSNQPSHSRVNATNKGLLSH